MRPIKRNFYRSGDHNSVSDDSGQKFKRSDMRFTWDGKLVSKDEWYPKHPQLLIRGRTERIAVTDGTRVQGDDLPLQDPPITPSQFL